MAEQITLKITWVSIVNACVDALQNPDSSAETRRDIRASMCQMARAADAAVDMEPEMQRLRDDLKQARRAYCRLLADYRHEVGMGEYDPSEIADELEWDCFK